MKFHDLALNQRFELDGVIYIKTSPVLAGKVDGGGSKFMARYVMVRLLDDALPQTNIEQKKTLEAGKALAAFDAYHSTCSGILANLSEILPVEKTQDIAQTLEGARQEFLNAILKG